MPLVMHWTIVVLAACSLALAGRKAVYQSENSFIGQINASLADVLHAVQEVAEDQIVHGTYSYEKERTLYGAHSATSARIFGVWQESGRAFYKQADKILAPRYFKDSGDIGTIYVRYVVQSIDADHSTVRIDAVFVDARNANHPSDGSIEAAEYKAIQDRLEDRRQKREEDKQAAQEIATQRAQDRRGLHEKSASEPGDSWALGLPVAQLEQRVAELRRDAELETRESGAALKAAPYRAAATLSSLPAHAQVLVVVLTPYWYGVQTEDGHRGWVHRSEVEPLP